MNIKDAIIPNKSNVTFVTNVLINIENVAYMTLYSKNNRSDDWVYLNASVSKNMHVRSLAYAKRPSFISILRSQIAASS